MRNGQFFSVYTPYSTSSSSSSTPIETVEEVKRLLGGRNLVSRSQRVIKSNSSSPDAAAYPRQYGRIESPRSHAKRKKNRQRKREREDYMVEKDDDG